MQRWRAYLPYTAVAVVHLTALVVGAEAVAGYTKAALMPALLLAFLVTLPTPRSGVALWGGAAIGFSWIGDLLVAGPGEGHFLLGLIGFLLAHVAYLVLFVRLRAMTRMPRLALLLVPWWLALAVVLGPHLGAFLVPVLLYGLVLGGSTAASLRTTAVTWAGSILFLLSDTVLAAKLFLPGFVLWQADLLVMLPYVAGQGLIAWGVVTAAHARTGT